jgi:hypothetical protein
LTDFRKKNDYTVNQLHRAKKKPRKVGFVLTLLLAKKNLTVAGAALFACRTPALVPHPHHAKKGAVNSVLCTVVFLLFLLQYSWKGRHFLQLCQNYAILTDPALQ